MESQAGKSCSSVKSKQETNVESSHEINKGILAPDIIRIKSEQIDDTELNESVADFENLIGNNDPINIKSENINNIVDKTDNGAYQHMMIGAGIFEDELEEKPQINLRGEVIDMELEELKDEPAEASGESSSEENNTKESANCITSPETTETELGYTLNKQWRFHTSNESLPDGKKYICNTCGYTNDQTCRMQNHLIVHSDKKTYQCDQCPMKTKHKTSLLQHVKYVHRNPDTSKVIACEKCDFRTHRKYVLKLHMMTHSQFTEPKKPKVEMYQCELCDYKSKKKYFVQCHVNIHRSPAEHDIYKCKLCPYTSKFKSGVSNHMTVHKKPSETRMYECELCPYKAKWPHCLRNHLKTHKKREVPVHKCEHCDFQANNKYSVATHQKFVHKELFQKPIKEYKCHVCSFTGNRPADLNRHKIVHEKIPESDLFTCGICGSRTKTKKNLKKHIFLKHASSNKRVALTHQHEQS